MSWLLFSTHLYALHPASCLGYTIIHIDGESKTNYYKSWFGFLFFSACCRVYFCRLRVLNVVPSRVKQTLGNYNINVVITAPSHHGRPHEARVCVQHELQTRISRTSIYLSTVIVSATGFIFNEKRAY